MEFTFYGHSCFSVRTAGKTLLFDPFISGNPLANKVIDIDAIQADYILVSHGHMDHLADVVRIATNTGATVIGAYEVVGWAQKQGVEHAHPMNFGPFRFDFGQLRFLPAVHSSSLPDGSYGGNPGGFFVRNEEDCFYYTGDTCLTMDMSLLPRYGKLDVAIMPIGGNYTMDIDDAVMAAEMVGCDKVIGVHFDTFADIRIDHEGAKEKFKATGKELILPIIGDTITL